MNSAKKQRKTIEWQRLEISSRKLEISREHLGMIKDRNGKDLTEAGDIKKRWQEYTEELYKKDLNDQDNHNGVVTHLEPDILECEVKWALGSIITNKTIGGDGIPVELFQILKDDAVKMLHSICQQICPVDMYRYECQTVKKAEHKRIDAFELWCWKRLLRVPWTAR